MPKNNNTEEAPDKPKGVKIKDLTPVQKRKLRAFKRLLDKAKRRAK